MGDFKIVSESGRKGSALKKGAVIGLGLLLLGGGAVVGMRACGNSNLESDRARIERMIEEGDSIGAYDAIGDMRDTKDFLSILPGGSDDAAEDVKELEQKIFAGAKSKKEQIRLMIGEYEKKVSSFRCNELSPLRSDIIDFSEYMDKDLLNRYNYLATSCGLNEELSGSRIKFLRFYNNTLRDISAYAGGPFSQEEMDRITEKVIGEYDSYMEEMVKEMSGIGRRYREAMGAGWKGDDLLHKDIEKIKLLRQDHANTGASRAYALAQLAGIARKGDYDVKMINARAAELGKKQRPVLAEVDAVMNIADMMHYVNTQPDIIHDDIASLESGIIKAKSYLGKNGSATGLRKVLREGTKAFYPIAIEHLKTYFKRIEETYIEEYVRGVLRPDELSSLVAQSKSRCTKHLENLRSIYGEKPGLLKLGKRLALSDSYYHVARVRYGLKMLGGAVQDKDHRTMRVWGDELEGRLKELKDVPHDRKIAVGLGKEYRHLKTEISYLLLLTDLVEAEASEMDKEDMEKFRQRINRYAKENPRDKGVWGLRKDLRNLRKRVKEHENRMLTKEIDEGIEEMKEAHKGQYYSKFDNRMITYFYTDSLNDILTARDRLEDRYQAVLKDLRVIKRTDSLLYWKKLREARLALADESAYLGDHCRSFGNKDDICPITEFFWAREMYRRAGIYNKKYWKDFREVNKLLWHLRKAGGCGNKSG